MPNEHRVTIEVPDPLGPKEAERILAILDGSDPGAAIVLDVRSVSDFEDHALVLIARALARREGPGSFIGLPRHHMRIMRYMGLSSSSKRRDARGTTKAAAPLR